jgi:prepilin-type N-terminal cleavage/methylation domain-containing protein
MKRAFTLIELLVVIAIISLLMALGLPVARLARERGAEAVCSSNLRQITVLLKTYCNDHDNLFPDPTYLYHSRKSLDPNAPVTYLMGCRWHDARIGPTSPLFGENKELKGSLIPYLGDPKILLCKTGARVNREQGCHNESPIVTYARTTKRDGGQETVRSGTTVGHDKDVPIVPQYTYAMNGNLYRTLQTASLDPKTHRERRIYRETHVTRSPSEVLAFGEENSWAINQITQGKKSYNLSGHWLGGTHTADDTTDFFIATYEVTGAITLGGLDIAPSYLISSTPDHIFASKVPAVTCGDAFATYHRPRGGDLNTGHSYVSMLDGHVRKVTVSDQLRRSREDPNLPPSRLGPGGNLHLAWPLDVPPLGGWENQ